MTVPQAYGQQTFNKGGQAVGYSIPSFSAEPQKHHQQRADAVHGDDFTGRCHVSGHHSRADLLVRRQAQRPVYDGLLYDHRRRKRRGQAHRLHLPPVDQGRSGAPGGRRHSHRNGLFLPQRTHHDRHAHLRRPGGQRMEEDALGFHSVHCPCPVNLLFPQLPRRSHATGRAHRHDRKRADPVGVFQAVRVSQRASASSLASRRRSTSPSSPIRWTMWTESCWSTPKR